MKSYSFTINGHKYNVNIVGQEDNNVSLEVNGAQYTVSVEKGATKLAQPSGPVRRQSNAGQQSSATSSSSSTAQLIKSPLPGNILTILVHPGDVVQKGQKLLTYEAMKMENDILAEGNGTVAKIFVSVGDTIQQGATLIEIK